MAEYEKVTPADFRERLKDGNYTSLTGARRAIGRMSSWTEQQKARARADAEKHFEGAPEPNKAKKVAKKAIKKKAKAAAKVPKRTVKNSPILKHIADNKRRATKKAKAEAEAKASPVSGGNVSLAANKIGTITQALNSMKAAKELGAGDTEVARGAKKAQLALTAIVEELCGDVAQTPLTPGERMAAEALAKAAAAAGNGQGFNAAPSAPQSSDQIVVEATAEL